MWNKLNLNLCCWLYCKYPMMTILIKSKKIISINDGDNDGIYKGDIIGEESPQTSFWAC